MSGDLQTCWLTGYLGHKISVVLTRTSEGSSRCFFISYLYSQIIWCPSPFVLLVSGVHDIIRKAGVWVPGWHLHWGMKKSCVYTHLPLHTYCLTSYTLLPSQNAAA